MASIPDHGAAGHAADHAAAHHEHSIGFVRKYVFSTDHKIIGIQFLFSTLLWFLVGGLLALGIRIQVAWPWADMPVIGNLLFSSHLLDEVEQVADHVTMISHGRIVLSEPLDVIQRSHRSLDEAFVAHVGEDATTDEDL